MIFMKNPLNYFRSYEEVRLGGQKLTIEHSALENLAGFGMGCIIAVPLIAVTSPFWISYGLYKLGKKGYDKIKKK